MTLDQKTSLVPSQIGRNWLITAIAIFVLPLLFGSAQAQTRVVEKEPIPTKSDYYRVAASQTHSGLPVPRFVSLKYGEVNGRQGPSLQHPILWQYQKKGLPVIVVAEMDIWRKVQDMNGDESWVRSNSLTRVNKAIARTDLSIMHRPRSDAREVAKVQSNAFLELSECNAAHWCKVKAGNGVKGWVSGHLLWGAGPI